MHDNGITQAFYNQDWLEAGEKKSLAILEKMADHCKIGEKNVRKFPFLTSPKNVVLYHHEYLDGSGLYGLESEDIPIMSQIICFADDIDMKFDLLDSSITALNGIQSFAKEHKGDLYHEEIVDAFLRLSGKISFWRDLNDENIYGFNGKHLGWFEEGIVFEHNGENIGFIESKCPVFTQFESFKSFKEFKPFIFLLLQYCLEQ